MFTHYCYENTLEDKECVINIVLCFLMSDAFVLCLYRIALNNCYHCVQVLDYGKHLEALAVGGCSRRDNNSDPNDLRY